MKKDIMPPFTNTGVFIPLVSKFPPTFMLCYFRCCVGTAMYNFGGKNVVDYQQNYAIVRDNKRRDLYAIVPSFGVDLILDYEL